MNRLHERSTTLRHVMNALAYVGYATNPSKRIAAILLEWITTQHHVYMCYALDEKNNKKEAKDSTVEKHVIFRECYAR